MNDSTRNNEICHEGRIINVEPDKIIVSIISQSACASCSSKKSCAVGDVEDKIIEIERKDNRQFAVNDLVTVVLNQSLGAKAVLLGYFFPFLVLLFTVMGMLALGFSEGVAGLFAIFMLAPYYSILYFTRKKQSKSFNFRIK